MKKQTTDIYTNMDKSHKHNAKQKKLYTKEYILYDSICKKFWNRQN